MSKPRLLIPLTMQFGVRYLLRTGLLARVAEYAQPVFALGWRDDALTEELERAGAEVHRLPGVRRGKAYERVRGALNVWHQARLASPSTAIDERRARSEGTLVEGLRARARRKMYEWQLTRAGAVDALLARERRLLREDTNQSEFDGLLATLRVDAAFSLTPYLPDEEMMLRACAARGLPLCAAILSFDNITTRGWIPVTFDSYLLWNRYNVDELRRGYPEAAGASVEIVGPAQFDFYWDERYLWDEARWRERLRLPAGRPVILYGAGYRGIVPHEPHFVAQLDAAVEAGEIPERPLILLRRHPVDPIDRWLPLLRSARHVVYDDPWKTEGPVLGRTNVRGEDIERLASSLLHSHVHVSVSSTMTIDGSIFDRPQVGPAYDDRRGGKFDRISYELYRREHYVPITDSGGLALVRSRAAMIAAVNDALREPGRPTAGREKLVREICTYADGRSTERVDAALRAFLRGESSTQAAPPFELEAAAV